MKIYYLINIELERNNIVNIALSPQKCIEEYTGGKVILKTDEEVKQYLEENITFKILSYSVYIGYKFIYDK